MLQADSENFILVVFDMYVIRASNSRKENLMFVPALRVLWKHSYYKYDTHDISLA